MSEERKSNVSGLQAIVRIPRWRSLIAVCSCVAIALAGLGLSFGQKSNDETDQTDRQKFMHGKLDMVHRVIDGIAMEDFDLVKKGALELAALSESATFKSENDPFYRHYSAYFERAVRDLIAAAESESVERTTFAYVHVTFSCTACHQHVRGTKRVASFELPIFSQ